MNAKNRAHERVSRRRSMPLVQSLESRQLFAAGVLDPSFAADGKVLTPIGQTYDLAQAQAVQANGKILIAGSSGNDVAVLRYNANGLLDTSFGPNFDGRATIDLGSSSETAYGVGVDSAGRIYLSGNSGGSGFVLRLTSSGSLDSSFSGDGKAFIPGAFITGLAVQDDNKVVVVGDAPGASFDFMIARFTTTGSLDGTFGGGDGIATRSFTAGGFELASSVAVQSDGYIVAAGTVDTSADGAGYDVAIFMTNPAGNFYRAQTVDASGAGRTDFGHAVTVGNDDSIYVAGQSYVGAGRSNFSVTKFNVFGFLATSFGGGDGVAQVSFSSDHDESANAIDLQSNGKIILAGDDGVGNFAVARLSTSGGLDTSFDVDGHKTIAMGSATGRATGVTVLGNGDILLSGTGGTLTGGNDFAATRLNSSGSNDVLFGLVGRKFTDFDTADDFADDVLVGPDNKTVVVGTRLATGNAPFGEGDFAVVRYTSGGALDTAFNTDGRLTTDFGGNDRATAVARQADGKIVVGGYTDPGPGLAVRFAVARYNTDGTLDNTFSGDGKQTISFAAGDAYAYDLRLQNDGKIVIVGTVANDLGPVGGDMAVVRLNSNGSLDSSFSGDGRQTIGFGVNPAAVARGVAIHDNGKIVLAGYAGFSAALVRLNANGSLDNNFSGDGKLTQDLGIDSPDYFYALDLQDDGKIVAGGSTGGTMALARFNTNGTIDASFDGDGIKTAFAGRIHDLKIESTGRITVAGTNQSGGGSQFRVARFNTNGSNDNTFSGDSVVDTQFAGSSPTAANALAFGIGGKVVVAGYSQVSFGNQDFAVARYSLV